MLTIKKADMIVKIPVGSHISLQETSDGLYFKFKDGSELMVATEMTPQVKAIASMLDKSSAKEILVDFNNPKQLMTISN